MLGPALLLALAADAARTSTPTPERLELALRLSLGGEWDTNPRRITENARGDTADGDGLLRLVADVRAELALGSALSARVRYLVGVKRFFARDREDLFAHDLSAEAGFAPTDGLELGAELRYRASRIRSRARDYSLIHAEGSARYRPLPELELEAHGGADVFEFAPTCLLSYAGPQLGGGLTWSPVERFEVGLGGGVGWRIYDGRYDPAVGLDVLLCSGGADRRRDAEPQASVHAAYRGAVIVGAELAARFSRSNDAYEEIDRYRLSAWATIPLPLELVLGLSGAVQFNRGSSVSDTLRAAEDDENQTGLEAQLSRPLGGGIELLLRYALYANAFATAPDEFLRQTVFGGLAYEL